MSDFIHTSVIQMAWSMNTEHVTSEWKKCYYHFMFRERRPRLQVCHHPFAAFEDSGKYGNSI